MKLREHSISGLFSILPELHEDDRGVFRRSFCEKELASQEVKFEVKQGNISENLCKHTLRGFHYQVEPTQESKILTCITGSVYNVVLDLRRGSKTYKKWVSLEICQSNRLSILVPAGCANAFLTTSDNTIMHYYMGDFFSPQTYKGIRYNDPTFAFEWPSDPKVISQRDLNFQDFQDD